MQTATTRLIRLPEVLNRTGLGRTSIYMAMKDGSFPKSIAIGMRSVAWSENEIDSWIAERQSGRAIA